MSFYNHIINIVIIIIIGAIVGYILICRLHNTETSSPVEERVDSLIKQNNEIKNKIDSIKHERDTVILKVKTLNNDSTLILFRKLIRE